MERSAVQEVNVSLAWVGHLMLSLIPRLSHTQLLSRPLFVLQAMKTEGLWDPGNGATCCSSVDISSSKNPSSYNWKGTNFEEEEERHPLRTRKGNLKAIHVSCNFIVCDWSSFKDVSWHQPSMYIIKLQCMCTSLSLGVKREENKGIHLRKRGLQ